MCIPSALRFNCIFPLCRMHVKGIGRGFFLHPDVWFHEKHWAVPVLETSFSEGDVKALENIHRGISASIPLP